tara:strand:- start:3375 stop:4409 length:1035 start_codon:yes stop_codon:yes gene_type:complete
MKSLIYGYGETGKSFERYLIKRNLDFEIYDEYIIEHNKKYDLKEFDQILCSPGIPKNTFDEINKINQNVITDIDIFFREDDSIKIGITGTNRKSTTAFHLHQLFKNFDAANLIGNIGNTMLDYINNNKKYSLVELSSFQLDKMKENQLDYGILLNIEIDHLDYHGNFESYKEAKEKILLAKNSISYESDPYRLFEWITNIKSEKIELKNLPFRYQKISENIINDSKSTNFHSLSYAVDKANNLFKNSEYILIVCGNPKKEEYRKISIEGPKEILIFGEHRMDIDRCINHSQKNMFYSLEDLLNSLKENKKNNNILFSPGYPSGKDFKNFVERGECFNQLVKAYL